MSSITGDRPTDRRTWVATASVVGAHRRPGLRTLLVVRGLTVPLAMLPRTLVAGGPWDADR
jgi:hypothetical protein